MRIAMSIIVIRKNSSLMVRGFVRYGSMVRILKNPHGGICAQSSSFISGLTFLFWKWVILTTFARSHYFWFLALTFTILAVSLIDDVRRRVIIRLAFDPFSRIILLAVWLWSLQAIYLANVAWHFGRNCMLAFWDYSKTALIRMSPRIL